MIVQRDKQREGPLTDLPLDIPCEQDIRQLSAAVQFAKSLFIVKKSDYLNRKNEVQFNHSVLIADYSSTLLDHLTRQQHESIEEKRLNIKSELSELCQHNEMN